LTLLISFETRIRIMGVAIVLPILRAIFF